MRSSVFVSTLLASLVTLSSNASAHIELLDPSPRYTIAESGDNKACPCGLGESNRLCDNPDDRSDPDRAAAPRVTALQSGSTLKLRFEEYVGHSGRYRVAIDYDGADLEDFNNNILLDVTDPVGSEGNIGQGSIWELDVPLPDVSCTNCTLQLLQMMDGNTEDPVPDPVGRSTYYTCADIELSGGTPLPDAGPDPEPGSDAGGSVTPDPGDEPVSGGCQSSLANSSTWAALFVVGLFALRPRKVAVQLRQR